MSAVLQTEGLPAEVQELLRQYMPTFVADNAIVLGGAEHMRLVVVGPVDAQGRPVARCSIDLSYEVAAGLAKSIQDVLSRRPS